MPDTNETPPGLAPGKKLIVYSFAPKRGNEGGAPLVKAGTAWVNRDGSINVYLDVLPLDGKLTLRPA